MGIDTEYNNDEEESRILRGTGLGHGISPNREIWGCQAVPLLHFGRINCDPNSAIFACSMLRVCPVAGVNGGRSIELHGGFNIEYYPQKCFCTETNFGRRCK